MTANSLPNTDYSPGVSTADVAADTGLLGGSHLADAAPQPQLPRRSLIGQALYDTFGQAGARIGAYWIVLVAVLGVFAPFLANSRPLVMRLKGGSLSLPLFETLGAVDVCAVILFVYTIWVLRRKVSAGRKIAALLWPLAVLAGVLLVVWYGPTLVALRVFRPAWLADRGGV